MFKDTEIDFTYPKKIKNSTIEGEYLAEFPKIHYKKKQPIFAVTIISGLLACKFFNLLIFNCCESFG
jgi:hypothetical protein